MADVCCVDDSGGGADPFGRSPLFSLRPASRARRAGDRPPGGAERPFAAPAASRCARRSTPLGSTVSTAAPRRVEVFGPPPEPPKELALYDLDAVQEEFVETLGEQREINLLVEGIHCAACVWLIETGLGSRAWGGGGTGQSDRPAAEDPLGQWSSQALGDPASARGHRLCRGALRPGGRRGGIAAPESPTALPHGLRRLRDDEPAVDLDRAL